jgi:hypothetical protein
MSWFRPGKEEREKERFYLLPGMGGRAYRRKQKVILQYTIVAGLLISACFALVLYWISRPHR